MSKSHDKAEKSGSSFRNRPSHSERERMREGEARTPLRLPVLKMGLVRMSVYIASQHFHFIQHRSGESERSPPQGFISQVV